MAPHVLSLLLLLIVAIPSLTIAQENGFWSIDCGGTSNFTSPETNITWVADGDYVKTGASRTVPDSGRTTLRPELRTLRVFNSSDSRLSCYTIPVGLGAKILVRAWFYYGNYDGLADPPAFKLLFDLENLATVTTTMTDVMWYRFVYVTRSSSTSICLGRTTTGHHPFISAFDVRTLGVNTYSLADPARPMYLLRSVALGALGQTRYPDDRYDRIWSVANTTGYTVVNSSATKIKTSIDDAPPEKILKAAITPAAVATNLTVRYPVFSSVETIYYTLYFSEVANLSGNGTRRSFDIYINGELVSNASDPMVPPFGGVWEFFGWRHVSNNVVVFDFVPTANSTLPPLLNAMELFQILDPVKNGTSSADVRGLSVLQNKFGVLQKWKGDPCLPKFYGWEWVRCKISDSESTRVTQLRLGGYNLSGTLPDFNSLTALEIIDLQDNSLSGEVPDFIAKLPALKILNLSNNNFSKIPPTLLQNRAINLKFEGNPSLCQPGKMCEAGAAPAPSVLPSSAGNRKALLSPGFFAINCVVMFFCSLMYI